MKRRLMDAAESGSLELLLDTLCNVFGGIVLIACLLAILPRNQMPPPLLPSHAATSEMIERRIIAANDEARRLQAEIERLSQSVDPKLLELQSRRDSLMQVQQRLEEDVKNRESKEFNEAEARALISGADTSALEQKLKDLKLLQSKAEGIDSAAAEKIRFMEQRTRNLEDEAGNLAKGRTQTVRFPRERATTTAPLPIIIRYNAIYPMVLGANMDANPAVGRIPINDGEAFMAKPVAGRGVHHPNDDQELRTTLKAAVTQKLYATLYLYPDSHEVFADLREALANAGLKYGLEFAAKDRELFFSSEGSAPPEL